MRHINQELRAIAFSLNRLEKLGYELKDGEFTQSSATALPFSPSHRLSDSPSLVVWYDVEHNEWRSDAP